MFASWDEEDTWFLFELDNDGWVTRHIELAGADHTPMAAASLEEWMHELDAGSVQQYQRRYGVLAEKPLAPDELDEWQQISPAESNCTGRRPALTSKTEIGKGSPNMNRG